MAFVNRYQAVKKGRMIITGNTMMLYQPTTTLAGPFTSTNTALKDGASPNGTTRDWTLNSAMAVLNFPAGATVEYAELTWTSLLSGGGFDVSANKNDAVNFITPTSVNTVSPQVTDDTGTNLIYTRSANVTSIVKASTSGQYAVGRVAGLNGYQVGANAIGWVLTVVFNIPTQSYKLFQINVGNNLIPTLGTLDFTLSNFSTPSTGAVTGRIFAAAQRGDPGVDLVTVFVGPTVANLNLQLTRPPMPANNMIIGIISNTDTGALIDTSGTFGNNNNGTNPPSIVNNARFHFDIATFDISASLTNNQNTLVTRSTSQAANATFNYNVYNLQVDVQAANVTPIIKTVDKTQATIGETLTYQISFSSTGQVPANNVIVTDTIPTGTSFVAGSIIVQGATQPPSGTTPSSIPLGTVAVGTRVTITFNVKVTTIPSPNPMPNSADVGYDFTSAPGLAPIHDNQQSNTVTTRVNYVEVSSSKTVSKAYANVGDILTYTIPIRTLGNTTAINIIFQDSIPNGTSLVSGSLTQNNVPLAGNPNPPGVSLNALNANSVTTIVFQVRVTTIPNPNPIPNSATTFFTYTVDNSTVQNRTASSSSNTNIVNTQVNNANLGNATKAVDKNYADCEDILNYTISIPNTGNVTAQNVIFKDTIPNGTVLLSTSVYVNGALQSGANPATGITVPNIGPGAIASITFSVLVQC